MSFKKNRVSSFWRSFAKTHLIEKQLVTNLWIFASSAYPTMFQKTNVVSSFTEDLPQNSCVEKEGVIGFRVSEKKGAPEMKGYPAMYMKTNGRKTLIAGYLAMLLIPDKLQVVSGDVYENTGA